MIMDDISHSYRILLFNNSGLLSRLIKMQTRCQFSHVGYHLGAGHVVEAWPPRVRIHHYNNLSNARAFVIRGASAHDHYEIGRRMKIRVGCLYDFRSVIRFLAWQKDSFDENWFCFELMHFAMRMQGFPISAQSDCRVDGRDFESEIGRMLIETPLPQ